MNGDIDTQNLNVVGGAEETIEPMPSPEQDTLWDALDEIFDVEALEREEEFLKLDATLRHRMASVGFAEDIGRIAEKFSLSPEDTKNLSRAIRYLSLKIIPDDKIEMLATEGFEITKEVGEGLARELRALLGVPETPSTTQETAPPLPSPTQETSPPLREVLPQPQIPVENAPFMLHEEKPIFGARPEPLGSPSVSFEPQERRSLKPSLKPQTARVEGPSAEPRVVHYSDLRTPLDKGRATSQ